MLDIDLETVCWLIVKVREFEAEDALPVDPDGDNETMLASQKKDEEELAEVYFQAFQEDPLYAEAKRVIDELNEDAQVELVALTWVGRGDYNAPEEWQEALSDARERHAERNTAEYLLGNPLVADYLEEGLNQLGLSCEGTEAWTM